MSLIWTFQINGVDHKAEWNRGAMRCTYEPVIVEVDRLIAEGYKLRCGSSTNMVDPTLQNEAGAFAVITAAVQFLGDYGSLSIPTSTATIVSDVVMPDAMDKAKSFGGDRSAAGRYAAQVRWGKGGGESSAGHGLNTNRPTQRAADGTLLVQGENGGWRKPTASERGVPTAKEAKQELSSEITSLGEISHYEATGMRNMITAAMTSITRFHKEHDAVQALTEQTGSRTARGEMSNLFFTAKRIWSTYGSEHGPRGGSADSRIKEIADSVHSKLMAIYDKMESLATPAR